MYQLITNPPKLRNSVHPYFLYFSLYLAVNFKYSSTLRTPMSYCCPWTHLSLERHQVCVQLTYGQNPGIVGGGQSRDVGLVQVHAFGRSAASSERVVSVLSSDALLLHRAGPAGRGFLHVAAAAVLLYGLRAEEAPPSCRFSPHQVESERLKVEICGAHLFFCVDLEVAVFTRLSFFNLIVAAWKKKKDKQK